MPHALSAANPVDAHCRSHGGEAAGTVPGPADMPAAVRLASFIATLSGAERRALKLSLSDRIPSFFDASNTLRDGGPEQLAQFRLLATTLRALTPHAHTIPPNGIAYYGRPAWLGPVLLARLQAEAKIRRELPLDRIDHYLGCGGPHADALSVAPAVIAFVSAAVGPVRATGIASYLFYDRAGLGIRPHVDTEVFSVNLMLMLRHVHGAEVEPSATVVFPGDGEMERYRLQPGEAMLMHGSSVIHARSLVQPTEDIALLMIGFNRA